MSRLIHPRMTKILERDFFPQRCALKKPIKSQSTSGKETLTYQVQAGYDALPCRVAPATGGERRGERYTHLDTTHEIALPGQFLDVTEEWVAEVAGQRYDILLIGRDAEGVMTHLEARIAR